MKKPSAKGFAVSAVSLGLVLVGGCAFWGPGGAPPKPANTAATNAVPDAAPGEADYRQGRSYQGSMQYAAAITAYRKALQENPGNAEAHNALGVAYASLGRHDEAVAELMTALALAPKAAHIYNNLGYAYLLHGSKAEALAILRLANTLEPADKRFLENMRAAEQSLTQGTQRTQGTQGAQEPARAPEQAAPTQPQGGDGDPAMPRLVSVAPNIFELREGFIPKMQAFVPPPASPQAVVKVEVANGSGVNGLARRTSQALKTRGFDVVRLTNQLPFSQATTEIQYRRGEETRAEQLNSTLFEPAKLVQTNHLSAAVGVRLLLGRDIGPALSFSAALPGNTSNRLYVGAR